MRKEAERRSEEREGERREKNKRGKREEGVVQLPLKLLLEITGMVWFFFDVIFLVHLYHFEKGRIIPLHS